MPTKDGFDPAHPLPQFLTDRAEQDIGNTLDGTVPASRTFKAGILIATATATGIAVLALEDPVALFAWGTASLVGNSSPQLTLAIQSAADAPAQIASTADAQALPPATPARNEIAASEPAGKDQTGNSEPSSEALFAQFQAWAAEREARARSEPVQPVQDAPAEIVQNASAQNAPAPAAENARVTKRLVQKRRQLRAAHNARAEMRRAERTQELRKQVRRAQSARAERPPMQAERPPVQGAQAQATSVQDAQAFPFLPIFGLRN
ncbi:hypothetical protein [Bradyrhizobium retamae]|nr:hypothetical protein [Bradyrhizobium retamae]